MDGAANAGGANGGTGQCPTAWQPMIGVPQKGGCTDGESPAVIGCFDWTNDASPVNTCAVRATDGAVYWALGNSTAQTFAPGYSACAMSAPLPPPPCFLATCTTPTDPTNAFFSYCTKADAQSLLGCGSTDYDADCCPAPGCVTKADCESGKVCLSSFSLAGTTLHVVNGKCERSGPAGGSRMICK
jgi:hypothetical protein